MVRFLYSALITGAFCVLTITLLPAQEKSRLDSLYEELDEIFAEDSLDLNLFAMTDSLLLLMDGRFHSVSIRGSFTSEVLTSGRDLGFSQNGWITGASYYHPTGFYGDLTGYLNSEYSPQYYLTDVGIGYLFDTDHWMLQASHNFQFFEESIDWQFNKSAQASAFYQRKLWEAGVDYRFMYGKETAHRITATAASRMSWRAGWIDRISVIPSVAIQWGNSNIIYFRQSETPVADLFSIIQGENAYPDLERNDLRRLASLIYRERYLLALQFLLENGYTQEDVRDLLLEYENIQYQEADAFGLMNIALNLGISLSKKQWNLYINYSYNLPQALPGEEYEYETNDYLSMSLFYTLIWPQGK